MLLRDDELLHYGVGHDEDPPGRGSGRYAFGSGENGGQRLDKSYAQFEKDLYKIGLTADQVARICGYTHDGSNKAYLDMQKDLKKQGLTNAQLAKVLGLGFGENEKDKEGNLIYKNTSWLRAETTWRTNLEKKRNIERILDLQKQGLNNSEIARQLGLASESSVRSLLQVHEKGSTDKYTVVMDQLKAQLKEHPYLDVGPGLSLLMNIPQSRLDRSIDLLQKEGYQYHKIDVPQPGTDHKTTFAVLTEPGVKWVDVAKNQSEIYTPGVVYKDVDNMTVLGLPPMKDIVASSIDPKRIKVVYNEEGGGLMDGVIQLRPGVQDLSLGSNVYAQVRIPVDGSHYLKGMAIYSTENMPKGVDIVFNTSKSLGTPLLDKNDKDAPQVLKAMKMDKDNPFGSTIKKEEELQHVSKYYIDPKTGEKKLSAVNIVSEEGTWDKWSNAQSAQFLSKQPIQLAKQQLNLAYLDKKEEFDSIKAVTNPTVKKILLEKFADGCDRAAVDLKAAPIPGQATKLLLPVKEIKDNEIYAPHLNTGDVVALVRFPHQGTFEIPVLRVNNNNKEAKQRYGNLTDAVGVGSKAAQQLSGADFDGDTAVVIPISRKGGPKTVNINTEKYPKELLEFNETFHNRYYDASINITDKTKGKLMGTTTNLLSDMTLQHAPMEHIIRATKHAMVVIDAQKHHLNYRQSEIDQGIRELKELYQPKYDENGNLIPGKAGGVGTLITRAKSKDHISVRKRNYKPDPETGEVTYTTTPEFYVDKKTGKTVERTMQVPKMMLTNDARTLMSTKEGLPIERVYANYANQMKALANEARKLDLATQNNKMNPSAKETYKEEVDMLKAKLNTAMKNAGPERQATLVANQIIANKKRDNPNMSKADLKKVKGQALGYARARVSAKKVPVTFTDREWEAIQAGAFGSSNLKKLINNANLDHVKKMATPRTVQNTISPAKMSLIKALLAASGGTSASAPTLKEIAERAGVSVSTVSAIKRGDYKS